MGCMFSGAVSPIHWLLLIVVLIVLFGAKRLPDVARGLGKSARILKSEVNGLQDDEAKRSEAKQQAAAIEAKPTEAQSTASQSTASTPTAETASRPAEPKPAD
jgi:sec-independent protein translocase protein TatA